MWRKDYGNRSAVTWHEGTCFNCDTEYIQISINVAQSKHSLIERLLRFNKNEARCSFFAKFADMRSFRRRYHSKFIPVLPLKSTSQLSRCWNFAGKLLFSVSNFFSGISIRVDKKKFNFLHHRNFSFYFRLFFADLNFHDFFSRFRFPCHKIVANVPAKRRRNETQDADCHALRKTTSWFAWILSHLGFKSHVDKKLYNFPSLAKDLWAQIES